MKITVCTAVLMFFLSACSSTKQVGQFELIKKEHRLIAILPADPRFTVDEAERNKIGDGKIKESEQQLAFMIQAEENRYFTKNSRRYSVAIQDIRETNEKLFSGGRTYEEYRSMKGDSLAKILGVDAVVFCNTALSKRMGDGEYVTREALGFLLLPAALAFSGSQFKVVIQLGIIGNGSPGILWNTVYKPTGNRNEDIFGIMRRTLKGAAQTFPYNK